MKNLDLTGSGDAATARLNRRHFLQLSGSMLTLAALSQIAGENARAADLPADNPFTLGVASGDPLPTGVVLWTRLAPKPFEPNGGMAANQEVPVQWEIADDETFGRIVQRGTALASSAISALGSRRSRRFAARAILLLSFYRGQSCQSDWAHAHRSGGGRAS